MSTPAEHKPSIGDRIKQIWQRLSAPLPPPGEAPRAVVPSVSAERVESPAEDQVQEWADEWKKPVTTDDPWTAPKVPQTSPKVVFDQERKLDWVGFLGVLFFASLLYLPWAGSFGLWDPWETHYGEVSRHMVETRDFISPWWGSYWPKPGGGIEGEGFFSKPILLLWMMAAGLEIWGFQDFAIRVGVAVISILSVGLTYMAGASIWSRRVGLMMAGVLATSPFFFFLARQAQTDMPFVSMLVSAMALFMMGAFGKNRRRPADMLHKVLFWASMVVLVVPQLLLMATDTGFSAEQRALRPALRAQSLMDFKAKDVWQQFVVARSPHLTPEERDTIQQMASQGEREAAIDAARPALPDYFLEMFPSYLAAALVIGFLVVLAVPRWRRQIGTRLWRAPHNLATSRWLLGLALLSQGLALVLLLKQLGDHYALNWESNFGAGFNLLKWSGVLMSGALLAITGAMFWRVTGARAQAIESGTGRGVWWGGTAGVMAVVVGSPLALYMMGRSLGVLGQESLWDITMELRAQGKVKLVNLFFNSGYAPAILGVGLIVWGLVWLTKRRPFWGERSALGLGALGVAMSSVIFACVAMYYIPATIGKKGEILTFGQAAAGKVILSMFVWGPVQVVLYGLCAVVVWFSLERSTRKTVGQYCFLGFYIFAALATMAKGLLGFMLPGAIAFIYLIVTVEWKRLLEFEIPRGLLVFTAVGVPWYASVLILHETAYFNRFFIHDHFKRLGSGVHQIDSGTIEHFIHWLGYGLFPWVALVPAAILRVAAGRGLLLRDDRSRATLLVAIWAVLAFTLFSVSSTKFHHYTFPVVPPLAILVGLLLADLMDGKQKKFGALALVSVVGLVLVGLDVVKDPQHWKNLFTYKYDREWIDLVPTYVINMFGEASVVHGSELHESFQDMALLVMVVAGVGLSCFFTAKVVVRRVGGVILMFSALMLAVWGLNVYMPGISPTWSQNGIWQAYYETCTPTAPPPNADPLKQWCDEPALVYKTTWRGEHYYSHNESIPILESDHLKHFIAYHGDGPFYFMVDRTRYCSGNMTSPNFGEECTGKGSSIVNEVKGHYKGPDYDKYFDHELIWDQNLKFIMIKLYPLGKPGARDKKAASAGD